MRELASVRSLCKSFGEVEAVREVSLSVGPGEVVGLLGANGAGKTTLIRCLLGLTPPTSGEVAVLGSRPVRETLRRVGYVPQGLGLYTDLSVAENLDFQRGVYGGDAAELDGDLAAATPTPVGVLPLGYQRRVAFAACLAHQPLLMVLDEPTSGVGALGRARIWETIRDAAETGIGVLVTTHHLEEAEQCDRLVMMAGGSVVAEGTVEDVIGGRTVISVSAPNPLHAYDSLVEAGLNVTFGGQGVRVMGSTPEEVRNVLGEEATGIDISEGEATLEEAFVAVVTGG